MSERSERVLASSTTELSHSIRLARSFCSCFIKNAPRFARCRASVEGDNQRKWQANELKRFAENHADEMANVRILEAKRLTEMRRRWVEEKETGERHLNSAISNIQDSESILKEQVSERSERALMKTRKRATKLTLFHSICNVPRFAFARRFARRSGNPAFVTNSKKSRSIEFLTSGSGYDKPEMPKLSAASAPSNPRRPTLKLTASKRWRRLWPR